MHENQHLTSLIRLFVLILALTMTACSGGGSGGESGNGEPDGQDLPAADNNDANESSNTAEPQNAAESETEESSPQTGTEQVPEPEPTTPATDTDAQPALEPETEPEPTPAPEIEPTPIPEPTPTPQPAPDAGDEDPPAPSPPAPALAPQLIISPLDFRLSVGGELGLMALVVDALGNRVANTPQQPLIVTWSSSDATVASVDNYGVVTGLAPGQTTLTAETTLAGEILRTTSLVTVALNPALQRLSLAPKLISLGVDTTQSLSVTANDAAGAIVTPGCLSSATVEFDNTLLTANFNPANATITLTGVASGIGFVNLNCDGYKSNSVLVEVSADQPLIVPAHLEDADFGADIDIAVHQSEVHIASYDQLHQRLVYNHYQRLQASWQSEVLNGASDFGRRPQIMVDTLRGDRIVICATNDSDLACWLRQPDDSWHMETVAKLAASATVYDGTISAAMAPDGTLWLLYFDGRDNSLKLASSHQATRDDWQFTTVARGGGRHNTLAMTTAGSPRIAIEHGNKTYYGAPGGPGAWQFELVDGTAPAGSGLKLAIANDNRPQLVYFRGDQLVYAQKIDQRWQRQVLVTANNDDPQIGFALDQYHRPQLSYYDSDHEQFYASYFANNQWYHEILFQGTSQGRYSALTIDRLGNRFIGYYHGENHSAQLYIQPPYPDYQGHAANNQSDTNLNVAEPISAAPTALGVSHGNGETQLRWNSASAAHHYNIYWNTRGAVSHDDSQIGEVSTTQYQHQGRLNGVTYYYAVSSVGDLGESRLSNEHSATPAMATPINLRINALPGRNQLSWDAEPAAVSYTLYWNTTGTPGKDDAAIVIDGSESSYTHQDLNATDTYYYAISASDGNHDSALSQEVASLLAPTEMVAQAKYEDGSIEISWQNVANASGYHLYYSDEAGVDKQSGIKISQVESPFIHGNLGDQTTYYYAVSAVNSDGESALSAEMAATSVVNQRPLVWRRASSLPTSRFLLAGAAGNTTLYASGGYDGDNILDSFLSYQPSSDRWQPLTALPRPRREHTSAVIDNKLFVIGGWSGSATLNSVNVYDPNGGVWSAAAPMPTARNNLTSAVVDGKIYVIGGWNGTALAKTEVFDPKSGIWRTMASMPTPRYNLTSAVWDSKIYVIGGWYLGSAVNTVEVFDTRTGTWDTVTPMPTPRSRLAGGTINGRLYAIGGWSGRSVLNTVEIYNPVNDTWSSGTAMPTARNGLTSAVLNGKLYAIGGWSGSRYVNTVEVLGREE